MLFVWRGLGYLVPAITMGMLVAGEALSRATTRNPHYFQTHGWPRLVALLGAAVAVWFLGKSFEKKSTQGHTFMGITMHYWAPVLAVLGVALSFHNEELKIVSSQQMTQQQVALGEACESNCTQPDGTAAECAAKCACVVKQLAANHSTLQTWSEFVELGITAHDKYATEETAVRTQCGFK